MKTAILDFGDPVGAYLRQQFEFDSPYTPDDIETIRGKSFSLMICTGAPGNRAEADFDPAADRAYVEKLIDCLAEVKAETPILLSTSDVFADPRNVDEEEFPTAEGLHPYGQHRLMLEKFFRKQFPKSYIVRLPTLFGAGLTDNVFHQLLEGEGLEEINLHSTYQYYPLARLWPDLQTIRRFQLSPAHLATEPIMTADLVRAFFPDLHPGGSPAPEIHYDILSRHYEYFNGQLPYLYTAQQIMTELAEFVPEAQPTA